MKKLNILIISLIFFSFTTTNNKCIEDLFFGYSIKKSYKDLYIEVNQDTNFVVHSADGFLNNNKFFYARRVTKTNVYNLADSVFLQVGITPDGNKINPKKITDTKYLKVCLYYKDIPTTETEYDNLKKKICKEYDFNNQIAHVKKQKNISGNGDVLFLENRIFPMVEFQRGMYQGVYSIEVKITDVDK